MSEFNGLQTTQNLPELNDAVKRKFIIENRKTENYRGLSLYIQDSFDGDSTKIYQEGTSDEYARIKKEGGAFAPSSSGIGYQKIANSKTFGITVDLTVEARRYNNKSREFNEKALDLVTKVKKRMELNAQHYLTFGENSSYTDMDGETVDTTTGDGLSLFNSAHTLKFSSTTYSNILSVGNQVSMGAFVNLKDLIVNESFDDYGFPIELEPNKVISTYDTDNCMKIREILKSSANPEGANSGVYNDFGNSMEHVMLRHLDTDEQGHRDSTKSKYWLMACVTGTKEGWQAYHVIGQDSTLVTPDMVSGKDPRTLNYTYSSYGMWDFVILNGKGIALANASNN